MPQALLHGVSHLCLAGWPGPLRSYFSFLHSWDDRCTSPHPVFYWLRWRSQKLFCSGWPQTVIFLTSTFQVTRITGLSHHAWLTRAI
jgi:hypothetical protein